MCRQAHIIRRSRHNWRSQHHLPKANIIQKSLICPVDKLGFFVVCARKARAARSRIRLSKQQKRCVNTGKNSKKYTKSKLFNASKKVRFVLWDKRLHICFTCAKRNYTFPKTSVIISPDIYLQGIFGQFLFIWIFNLLGFFCKINYV